MDQFEKVERIALKAGVSFEEAKTALEENNWDMLDAMLALERKKSAKPKENKFSTNYESQPGYKSVNINGQTYKKKKSFGEKLKTFFKKSHINHLVVRRGNSMTISLPLWLAALLIIRFWRLSILLLIIGLISGCKIALEGPDMGKVESVNDAMDSAAQSIHSTAKELKKSFSEGYKKGSENKPAQNTAKAEPSPAPAPAPTPEAESHMENPVPKASAADVREAAADSSETSEASEPKAEEDIIIIKTVNGQTPTQFENKDFSEVYGVFGGNSVTTDDGTITLEL